MWSYPPIVGSTYPLGPQRGHGVRARCCELVFPEHSQAKPVFPVQAGLPKPRGCSQEILRSNPSYQANPVFPGKTSVPRPNRCSQVKLVLPGKTHLHRPNRCSQDIPRPNRCSRQSRCSQAKPVFAAKTVFPGQAGVHRIFLG